jgi:FkbM family methyltransferase
MILHSIYKKFMNYIPDRIIRPVKKYIDSRSIIFNPKMVYRYCGFTLPYTPTKPIIHVIEANLYWEEKLTGSIIRELTRIDVLNPIVLDIGANIGLVSLSIISSFPSAKIFAFEPAPFQCELLKKTISANQLSNQIFVAKTALGYQKGLSRFSTHIGIDASGLDGFIDTKAGGIVNQITVEVEALDNWWIANDSPHINLIKIDTEGSELLILKGAQQVLQTCKPIIFIEIAPEHLKHYSYSVNDIIAWFKNIGYVLETIDGHKISENNFTSHFVDYNYIAIPEIKN